MRTSAAMILAAALLSPLILTSFGCGCGKEPEQPVRRFPDRTQNLKNKKLRIPH